MSNIRRETNWWSLSTLLRFWWDQRKKELNTVTIAQIETYDAETRRARVRSGIRIVMTDGTAIERAPIINVPCVYPAGGGMVFTFPVQPGDWALVVFASRGLSAWKQSFTLANPDPGRILDETDAIALLGFGPLALTPASSVGASLQTHDGTQAVTLEPDRVILRTTGTVLVGGESGQELVTRAFLTTYYNTHTHPPTGGPPVVQAPATAPVITTKQRSE